MNGAPVHSPPVIVLGSSSPRRRELLGQLFPTADIRIHPPEDDREEDLSPCRSRAEIEQGLLRIATAKAGMVERQWGETPFDFLLTADTAVVVPCDEHHFRVLGKPDPLQYPDEVRGWFHDYYLGRTHEVMTAIHLLTRSKRALSRLVTSRVTFASAAPARVDWYLRTGESLGKAGGYALQGIGGCFVEQLQGSLSNVVGLPLLETLELFEQGGWQSVPEQTGRD